MNGPHSDPGIWRSGYWAAVNEAQKLNPRRISQLLSIEELALSNTRKILAWQEGRRDGFLGELAKREQQAGIASAGQRSEKTLRGRAS